MQYDIDVQSEHKDLFLKVREVLLSFDGISEEKKLRITTYSDRNGGVCHLRTMPHGIDIGFLKGAEFDDELGLLSGSGKKMRVLSLRTFYPSAIRFYVRQAVRVNARCDELVDA